MTDKKVSLWALLLLLLGIVILFSYQKIWHFLRLGTNENYTLLKDYLGVIFSLPVAILVIGLVFIYKFSPEIRRMLTSRWKLRGKDWELQNEGEQSKENELNKSITESAEDVESLPLTENVTLTKEEVQEVVNEIQSKEQQIEHLKNIAIAATNRAELFEFIYLNSTYLVYTTKNALLWFYNTAATYGPPTKRQFMSQFLGIPPNISDVQKEKEAIFDALKSYELITEEGVSIVVTEKGKRFLKYIGKLND